MYLIEIKLGNDKIRKYVPNADALEKLILENPQYEYVKIIEEVKNTPQSKPKTKVLQKK